MSKPMKMIKKLLSYQVPLLLVWPALLYLSSVVTQMEWTRYFMNYSYMLTHYAEFLKSAANITIFLWLAFFLKRMLRALELFHGERKLTKTQQGGQPQLTKSPFEGKGFALLYCVFDVMATGVWLYLAVSLILLTFKSSSPINYARYFAKDGIFPYSVNNIIAGALAVLVSGALSCLLRKQHESLQNILQGVFFFSAITLIDMALIFFFKLDLTIAAEWLLLAVTLYLVGSITFGMVMQIKRLGNMNFARLRPLLMLGSRAEQPQAEDNIVSDPIKDSRNEKYEEAAPQFGPISASDDTAFFLAQGDLPLMAQSAAPARRPLFKSTVAQKKSLSQEKSTDSMREKTGLSFKSLWTVHFTLRMIPYMVLFVGLVLLLSTTAYTIQPNEQALVYRFGKLQPHSVTSPGLHLKLPFPIDMVEIHDVLRMKSLYVGYTPDPTNDNYLWTSTHGGEEYTLLSGNGNELIAVNMRLNYYIDDLMSYRTCFSVPDTLLNDYAYVIMMKKTMSSNLDSVLSVDRVALANDVRASLNEFSDEQKLGLQVANVIVESIHPPVQVSEVYQNVINASIQKTILTTVAQSYAMETLSAAEQSSMSAIGTATKAQITKVAQASREAEVFIAACEGYREQPDSYMLYKLTNAFQQLIANTKLYVFSPQTQREMDRFLLSNGQNTVLVD